MTREEAEELAGRFSREHADRDTHVWLARREEGDAWSVVKVARSARVERGHAVVEARPKPPYPDDPRPLDWRNVSPY